MGMRCTDQALRLEACPQGVAPGQGRLIRTGPHTQGQQTQEG